jgi:hypothetical protein
MALHILCEENVRIKLDTLCLTEDTGILPRVCREACKSSDISVKVLTHTYLKNKIIIII